MERELIIDASGREIKIALLEDKELVELDYEDDTQHFTVGDILLGQVKKLVPGLNAAFVDVGYQRDAFLHYTDLSPYIRSLNKFVQETLDGKRNTHDLKDFKFEPRTVKTGSVTDVLKSNQPALVQVLKEPISSKGPRLTCELTLPGRYVVLYPFGNNISISRKISSRKERTRLQRLVESIKPPNFGIILRTVAEGKKVAELNEDIRNQLKKWEMCWRELRAAANAGGQAQQGKVEMPKKLLSEVGRAKTILRDLFNTSFKRIVVNNDKLFEELKGYVSEIAPDKQSVVEKYRAEIPIFEKFNVNKQIKASFGNYVSLPGGAYLIIERTEAFHVIDVNSGKKVSSDKGLEENVLKVNVEAAKEIAKQVRLRDLGGIILIDFIDLRNPANKKKVLQTMKDEMKRDRTRHTLVPMSRLGIMQIARQRVRPALNIKTAEKCPTCHGKGEVQPTLLVIDQIKDRMAQLAEHTKVSFQIRIYAHPFVVAYLSCGMVSGTLFKWMLKYRKWIKVIPNSEFGLTEFEIFYKQNGKWEMLEAKPEEKRDLHLEADGDKP